MYPILEGIRVLALENYLAGPFGSMWLADAGADVIKIERPGSGDAARNVQPYREKDGMRRSLSFMRANRNKRSLTLNLKHDEGRELFLELVSRSDVVWENLRPGALNNLGLDYRTLHSANPRIIFTSVSGFGQGSQYEGRPAFDIIGQALSGVMWRATRGDTPVYLGFPLADLFAATTASFATVLALFYRESTGSGMRVDASMMDGMVALNELAIALYSATGNKPEPGWQAIVAPFGIYSARDGFMVIGVVGNPVWERFCTAIDREDLLEDSRFENDRQRGQHREAVDAIVSQWLSTRSIEEAVTRLTEHGVPASRIHDVDDLFRDSYFRERGSLQTFEDPAWGELTLAANPMKCSLEQREDRLPPDLGADTDDVLFDLLGMDADHRQRLRECGIV